MYSKLQDELRSMEKSSWKEKGPINKRYVVKINKWKNKFFVPYLIKVFWSVCDFKIFLILRKKFLTQKCFFCENGFSLLIS